MFEGDGAMLLVCACVVGVIGYDGFTTLKASSDSANHQMTGLPGLLASPSIWAIAPLIGNSKRQTTSNLICVCSSL